MDLEVLGMEYNYDVFISYKNDGEGLNFAAKIYSDLKKMGYNVYYNMEEQHSGSFPENLKNAVESCLDFILVITQSCLDQLIRHEEVDWVRTEILLAYANNKNIIPLLMPGVSMPKDKNDMPEDLRFLPDKNAVTVFEPYNISPLDRTIKFMSAKPSNSQQFKDTFQSNRSYNVNEDFSNVLALAESGDVKAMYELANMYFYGFTNESGKSVCDYEKAHGWIKRILECSPICSREYSAALSMMGELYYCGIVPKEQQSFSEAISYHRNACAMGVAYSEQKYAFMLSTGIGCEFDYDKVELYYSSAIKNGDNFAVNGLALFYLQYGEFEKAAELYKSIMATHPFAAYKLGCLYMNGVLSADKKPDGFKAAYFFQYAIEKEKNNFDAYYQLGLLYFRGTNGFINDFKIAQEKFLVAADNGNIHAAYMLGYMYEYGFVEKDLKKAIYYHSLAADRGNPLSSTRLAILYQLPECQNYQKAVKYAKMAAGYGDMEGEFIYGNLLFFGRGCEANNNEAYVMYRKALDHGFEPARFMMERIARIEGF